MYQLEHNLLVKVYILDQEVKYTNFYLIELLKNIELWSNNLYLFLFITHHVSILF